MKKLLLIISSGFSLILFPSLALAAPAWVRSYSHYDYPVTSTQFTVPNVGSGNLLVVAIRLSTGGATTVTSPGASWTKDVHVTQSSLGWTFDVWSAPNVPGGNTTITVSITGGGTSVRIVANEYSGIAANSPAHKTSGASGTSGSVNAGSVTTTINNCTLFAAAATDSDLLGWKAGSNYTIRNQCTNGEPGQKLCTEDRGPVAAGTYSDSFTINSDSWAAILVAYAPASGSDTTPPAAPTGVRVQ